MNYRFFLFFLFISNFSQSQTITGKITDSSGVAIPSINVIIKKIQQPNLIFQFTKTNNKGIYTIVLKEPLDSILIEISTISHEPILRKLYDIQKKGEINTQNFLLQERITTLKEVVISENKPIRVKKDTVIYDAQKFKDGSEKVIEDLLKKLPGITVEDNGQIKYNGKAIKKMLLDGDDLFDSQYSIGSKNITADLLDKVEAIDNYNSNAVLKGLVSSDDVAINLKLKKGKTDFSGNSKIGFGFTNKFDLSLSGLLINSKTKSFGISSYNNIGTNNTPYNFISNALSVESLNEQKFIAKEIINPGSFSSFLDDKFHRINNNFYTSFNSLYKFSSKITARVNLGFYSDELTRINKQITFYNTNEDSFTSNQSENIAKSPKVYSANLQLINKVNSKLSWEYLGKFNYQTIDYKSVSSNNDLLQSNRLSSENWFTKQDFNVTKRLSENDGLTGIVYYTNSNAPQNYILTPGNNIQENQSNVVKQNIQNSRFNKEVFNTNTTFLHKSENFKFAGRIGYYAEKNGFRSLLQTVNENDVLYSNPDFQNNLSYNYSFPYLEGGVTYNKDKFTVKIDLGSQYFDLKLKDSVKENNNTNKELTFTPRIKLLYRLTKHTNIFSSYSFNQIAPQETNLFEGVVQTAFGSFSSNEANIQFLKTHNYTINLNYGDSFYMTNMSLGFNYNRRENNYFYKSLINQNYTVSTGFLLNSGSQDYGFNFTGRKYVYLLRTDFKLRSNYNISLYKNIVNNSDLRDIKAKNLDLNLTTNSAIIENLSIENVFSYRINKFTVDEVSNNKFSSIKNSFKTVLKTSERFKTVVALDYIIPDLSFSKNYWFLDSEITFTSKNKKIDYSIIGRNLTNNKKFEMVNINDYSKNISSHNLIQRFILASVAFKF
ncbi:hypothetical protein NYQ10_04230 [Flavobacterium johnsoniae]|uniref:hypothetical protein n=1 Tax=Flavobacterium johnsoniae TaxID=986 RepID=UPI0025AF2755|nr:hypothetical protein [Flavobacterium johnsoniae]WJS95664.1 hypothetical protein NYQ10_04230 [Flavobacterium johnsoniae]